VNELERNLVALGRELDVPDAPELAERVLAQLGSRKRPASRRRLVLALAAVLVAALLAALAIPDARSALARFLNIGAARIELVDELPEVAPPTSELELTLGSRVTLDEARQLAGFDLLELEEPPDAVYLGERGTVWFLYGRPDAPRLLVAQTPFLVPDEPAILKKLTAEGTAVSEIAVRGERAFLLSGDPHLVFLVDAGGETIGESARLARDVLVWVEDGRTIRLEGELSEQEATRIAESLSVRPRG
jgi:hypothetical protein